jgi:hypothetical protein
MFSEAELDPTLHTKLKQTGLLYHCVCDLRAHCNYFFVCEAAAGLQSALCPHFQLFRTDDRFEAQF